MRRGFFTILLALCACPPEPAEPPRPAHDGPPAASDDGPRLAVVEPMPEGMTVDGVTRLCDDNLNVARELLASIKAMPPDAAKLTWASTLGRLDDAFLAIDNASEVPYLMGVVHPEKAVREAAQKCETKTDELMTSIWLDAMLAAVIKAYAEKGERLTPERQRFLEHTLRDFRRNGAELPRDKQERVKAINQEETQISQAFVKAISETQDGIDLDPKQLAGMPKTWVDSHPTDPAGKVRVSVDYPDVYPFFKYALDRKAALDLYVKFDNRGGEANLTRLDQLLLLRHEKAQLLGYETWADYAVEPRMAKDPGTVAAFLDRVATAIAPAVKNELSEFRAELAALKLGTSVLPPDRYFLTERIKEKRHQFDSKELENYFEIDAVTRGLFDITAKMYGLEYRTVTDPVWHPSVTVHEVWAKGRRIGKFYLDLHPRESKYKHAAMFPMRTAKKLSSGEQQTPMAALVCNFPEPGQPMPHDQVVVYFHEFGHVLHHLLTETELASFAGTNCARDFVEAPSQMFEEWAWSKDVLDRFARHRDTKEKIPASLVAAMQRARKVGLALHTERQLWIARLDLEYHSRKPPFDTTDVLREVHDKYSSIAYVPGSHFQSSFGHLIGYDAAYYGYQWALALAHDVLGRFSSEGLFSLKAAGDWRDKVLARGGSRDERELLHEFLGREPTEQAYARFLGAGAGSP